MAPSRFDPVLPRLRARGVTLVELLVTLVIALLAVTVTVPVVSGALARAELRGTVGELAATLREARSRARLQGEPVALIVDLEARRFGIAGDGSSHPIDDDLALRLTTARLAGGGSPTAEVRFFPDGTASGGEIVVARGEARYTVRVEWLTGRVRVREGGDGPAD